MRKIWILICVVFLCAGCSAEENAELEELQIKEMDIEVIDEFSGEYDFAYEGETDAQSDSQEGVYAENGIYHLNEAENNGTMLCFYDFNAKREVPVCSKGNCTHQGTECDAYFSFSKYPTMSPEYYEGNLYVMALDADYFVLQRVSSDGAERETVCRLMRRNVLTETLSDGTVSTSNYYPEICIHRGYVYYTTEYPGCTSASLCRVAMKRNAEVEVLHTVEGEGASLYRLKGYGRYLMFQMGTIVYEDITPANPYGSISVNLYGYDTENDVIYCVGKNVVREYTLAGTKLYYFLVEEARNIHEMDLETGEDRQLYEIMQEVDTDDYLFVRDGNVVYNAYDYAGGSCEQTVLDEDGRIQRKNVISLAEERRHTSEEWIYPY